MIYFVLDSDCTEETNQERVRLLQVVQQIYGKQALVSLKQAKIDISGINNDGVRYETYKYKLFFFIKIKNKT